MRTLDCIDSIYIYLKIVIKNNLEMFVAFSLYFSFFLPGIVYLKLDTIMLSYLFGNKNINYYY